MTLTETDCSGLSARGENGAADEEGAGDTDPDPAKYPAPGLEKEPETRGSGGDEDEQLLLFEELLCE
ncbi:hypothetical protein SAMN05446589_1111 [Streptomyces sp. OV198]|uniref:hypothetical protein n=1 Tax=Streptomyces sp. OV198 TaxID=1882787 RepID=UPI000BD6CC34|nr:hypothetical protein [Streptomyces sp. OV198]SOE56893.1 hypothetical protein SAMN05446589_1111 [Streptomyces sp. OV198]